MTQYNELQKQVKMKPQFISCMGGGEIHNGRCIPTTKKKCLFFDGKLDFDLIIILIFIISVRNGQFLKILLWSRTVYVFTLIDRLFVPKQT